MFQRFWRRYLHVPHVCVYVCVLSISVKLCTCCVQFPGTTGSVPVILSPLLMVIRDGWFSRVIVDCVYLAAVCCTALASVATLLPPGGMQVGFTYFVGCRPFYRDRIFSWPIFLCVRNYDLCVAAVCHQVGCRLCTHMFRSQILFFQWLTSLFCVCASL